MATWLLTFVRHHQKPELVEGVRAWPQVFQRPMRHRGFTHALAVVTPLGYVAGQHELSQIQEYTELGKLVDL